MVEWSLMTPKICGLNPDIGKILSTNSLLEKTKMNEKRLGMAQLLKNLKMLSTKANTKDRNRFKRLDLK